MLARYGLTRVAIALCVATITLSTQAAPQYGTVTISKVISVYDGDTFRVNIDSLPPIVGKNIAIRVNGVDTPEIRGKCQYEKNLALEARDFVRGKVCSGPLILDTFQATFSNSAIFCTPQGSIKAGVI